MVNVWHRCSDEGKQRPLSETTPSKQGHFDQLIFGLSVRNFRMITQKVRETVIFAVRSAPEACGRVACPVGPAGCVAASLRIVPRSRMQSHALRSNLSPMHAGLSIVLSGSSQGMVMRKQGCRLFAYWPPGWPLTLAMLLQVFGDLVLAVQIFNLVLLLDDRMADASVQKVIGILICWPRVVFVTRYLP